MRGGEVAREYHAEQRKEEEEEEDDPLDAFMAGIEVRGIVTSYREHLGNECL